MRIAGDLERIGDLAKNIAKRAIKISDYGRVPRTSVGLKHMASVAIEQLRTVLEAYLDVDIESARDVWIKDAEIDAIEDATFRDLLTYMMEDPRQISYCTHLLFCTKNIERIGDHATNIAESVYYISTGEALPIDRPKSLEDGGG
jgi:phosphate transport system protein